MSIRSVVPLSIRPLREGYVIAAAVVMVSLVGIGPACAEGIENPLTGVSPDFGLFAGALDASWKRVVAFVWALVIIGSSVRVIIGAFKVKRARSRGYANDLAEGSEELQDALVSLGLVGLASPIVATVLFVVGGH
ncbi:hypothetical protein D5S18_34210 [Nocardia panacis]|uniref:Uncharacterized protein n=1 Tax=Nocardia panacis TaxID=2340916 RepID=A0A3A4KGI8_9NOCA|nr:hypothetical protein [Nocardia panacis]RJO67957.1 hypothetical protein D5S18_34210 [Nocardia panacis]